MTSADWWETVEIYTIALRGLVERFHPCRPDDPALKTMKITAPSPEGACREIRERILEEVPYEPLEGFDKALVERNYGMMTTILNDAWFGMPESTEVHALVGFNVLCMLLDNPPEEGEEET